MTRLLSLPLPFLAAMMLFAYLAFALLREAWRYQPPKPPVRVKQARQMLERSRSDWVYPADRAHPSGRRREGQ